MTPQESAVFEKLKRGVVVTNDELAEAWGSSGVTPEGIRTIMHRIRKKRPTANIICLHGRGYVLGEPEQGFDGYSLRTNFGRVYLTGCEQRIFAKLYRRMGKITRLNIPGWSATQLSVVLHGLRRKIKETSYKIKTYRGQGYILQKGHE